MPYDPTNRRDVKTAQKQAKVADQQRREIVNGIMSVGPGRRWICDLLETCHIFATSYSDVGLRMAFLEGQREIGIRLLMDIMASCPDQYVTMMRERNERQSANDSRSERRREDANGGNLEPDDSGSGDDSTDVYDEYGDAERNQST